MKVARIIFGLIALIFLFTITDYVFGDEVYPNLENTLDFTSLEQFITHEMEKRHIPGLSIAIFINNGLIHNKGFGVKDYSHADQPSNAVDENTLFIAASISKPVTAYAALILVERGILSLDEPLTKYLKAKYLPNQEKAQKITLRMILNHTSGLSNDASGEDRKVYFTPGAYFSYSNAGFRYLQQVIEDVTGESFKDFINAEVLEPLNMKASGFSYQDYFEKDMALGHFSGKKIRKEPLRKVKVNASYSLIATPADIVKFAMELCQPTLLKPETAALITNQAVKYLPQVHWGLGIGILIRPTGNFLWQWGNNVTYQSMMLVNPQSKSGVIIMTNSNNGLPLATELVIKTANELFGDPSALPRSAFDFLFKM